MFSLSCIDDCLKVKNPLSRQVVQFLIEYSEEDDKLDYKADFVEDERHWLEMTKDISAFANTYGGYLVYGIEDVTGSIVGIERKIAKLLKNTNNLQQKLNRNLEPPIAMLRSKEYRFDGKSVVTLYVPKSKGLTHLVSKDGNFAFISGVKKYVLRKGTFYVRRSAGNHLADSRDLDAVVDRRIEQFQESLKDKIVSVIEAPKNSELVITTEGGKKRDDPRYILSDSEEAVPIKGVTFTKSPETIEQEIMGWLALTKSKAETLPAIVDIWRWYHYREKLQIEVSYLLAVFQLALWLGAPSFLLDT